MFILFMEYVSLLISTEAKVFICQVGDDTGSKYLLNRCITLYVNFLIATSRVMMLQKLKIKDRD